MAAGAKQKKGESRTDLIGRNKAILKSAMSDMKPFRDDTVILVVANPVDVLTYFAQEYAGLPRNQVIGSGTFLDSARLRGILAGKAGVAASSVDALVLGEHGESQFVAWSLACIGGVPLSSFLSSSSSSSSSNTTHTMMDKDAIAEETRNKATAIIENKGATNYGIGGVAASICKSILFDEKIVRPVRYVVSSSPLPFPLSLYLFSGPWNRLFFPFLTFDSYYQDGLDVCLSMPAVLGRRGVVRSVQMPLSEEEKHELEKSAKALREVIDT
jgi:L-lactate dehydrogenase